MAKAKDKLSARPPRKPFIQYSCPVYSDRLLHIGNILGVQRGSVAVINAAVAVTP